MGLVWLDPLGSALISFSVVWETVVVRMILP
jgi:hypothetical protein